jgi:molybdate transport system regulatory protein
MRSPNFVRRARWSLMGNIPISSKMALAFALIIKPYQPRIKLTSRPYQPTPSIDRKCATSYSFRMTESPSAGKAVLKPRLRVVCGKDIALGPGKAALLELLIDTGSLTEAARRLDMSYMRAWTLVKTMNQCFRQPVAVAERGGKKGGGMTVTATGRRVLALYWEMESSALSSTKASWKSLQKLMRA